jgi:hypothetical protein
MSSVIFASNLHGGYHRWSHDGLNLQIGWKPSGGEVIELLVTPGITPYESDSDEVFGENPEFVAEVCEEVLGEALNLLLCELMAAKARRSGDEKAEAGWMREHSARSDRLELEMKAARSKVIRIRNGTEVSITRVCP